MRRSRTTRRATLLLMVVGLLATLFLILSAYLTLARFERLTLQSMQRFEAVDQVISSAESVVLATVRQAWADGSGQTLAGGRSNPDAQMGDIDYRSALRTYSDVDVPGVGGTSWLASLEPVRDRDFSTGASLPLGGSLEELRLLRQVPSSFDGTARQPSTPIVGWRDVPPGLLATYTRAPRLGMMLEDPGDPEAGGVDDAVFEPLDMTFNARRPFMDADADGVTDTLFNGVAPLTQLANASANVAVRPPGKVKTVAVDGEFNPSAVTRMGDDADEAVWALWDHFDQHARYEVPAKVVSHGGMIALQSPGTYTGPGTVWNRQFVTEMFNWVRNREDGSPDMTPGEPLNNRQFNDLADAVAAVEPLLRHRGGVIPTAAEVDTEDGGGGGIGVPTILWELERWSPGYLRTFVPDYNYSWAGRRAWQRYNVAMMEEVSLWRDVSMVDPDVFNANWAAGSFDARLSVPNLYGRRHLLTTISNSDDLARELDPAVPAAANAYSLGIFPGQLKYYLGNIQWAFDPDGSYRYNDDLDPVTGVARGNKIVREIANYYYEMLSLYDGWNAGGADDTEAVSRRQQAFMLAVNTVAFAAPRDPATGFIDSVWYRDMDPTQPFQPVTYFGYAPQLFITEVQFHNEAEEEEGGPGPGAQAKRALGVELYYPHDPGPNAVVGSATRFTSGDPYALDLSQYAISLNESLTLYQLGGAGAGTVLMPSYSRLRGRSFVTLSLRGPNGSDVFDTGLGRGGVLTADANVDTIPITKHPTGWQLPDSTGTLRDYEGISVKLWRKGLSDCGLGLGGWYVVDEYKLAFADASPAHAPHEPSDMSTWVMAGSRDTGADFHLGGDFPPTAGDGLVDEPACWHVVAPIGTKAQWGREFSSGTTTRSRLGDRLPFINGNLHEGPSIPLMTMNAGAQDALCIHGAYRPASFPTVGMLHFVPRFAHVHRNEAVGWRPMGEWLAEQWANLDDERELSAAEGTYPADFGHMPLFDNQQEVFGNNSYFDNSRAGRIPWGLLVYDYFTTLNPLGDYDLDNRPDLDPRKIPGRININTAPWYVLAGLPVIDPAELEFDLDGGGVADADPAFWSAASGMLNGSISAAVDDFVVFTGTGFPNDRLYRFETANPNTNKLVLTWEAGIERPWWHLGPFYAQAIASYRDRVRYTSESTRVGDYANPYWAADRRNKRTLDDGTTYDPADPGGLFTCYRNEIGVGDPLFAGYAYGSMRRDDGTAPLDPSKHKYGFLTLGELANVKGFDSPVYLQNVGRYEGDALALGLNPLGPPSRLVVGTYPLHLDTPDFVKAVSLLAMLDTHFLCTRSNTFTVYMTLAERDPERAQASVRVQYTVDRSNLLPTLVHEPLDMDGDGRADDMLVPKLLDRYGTLADTPDTPVLIQNYGEPELITRRQIGYYDTQFDQ